MDQQTISYYDNNAGAISEEYEKAGMEEIHGLILKYLPKDGQVFEIGTGSGREAAYIFREGFSVTGIDASASMVKEAAKIHPELKNKLSCTQFPLHEESQLLKRQFDAVISIATLMHVPEHDLFECVTQIKTILKPGGTLFISSSLNRENVRSDRDDKGRLLIERPAEQVQLLFERAGFQFLTRHKTPDSYRRHLKWYTLVMRKGEGEGARSIDEIETIIRRDRKDATYKLALLRALCEVAQTDHFRASWRSDGRVAVPLGLVAEKWLEYYWPIIEQDGDGEAARIPQKRGLEVRKPIAFRKFMRALIYFYRSHGGMNAFFYQYRNNDISQGANNLVDAAMNSIARTIVAGPVTYAGGALESEAPYFSFEGKRTAVGKCTGPDQAVESLGAILVPWSTWREMCLIGHWVSESLIIRWAELTHEISRKQVEIKDVVDLLLRRPENNRDVELARTVYSEIPNPVCVWTGQSLSKNLVVDHTLPFSVWRNNDLWNLLPTARCVNSKKTDKLVKGTVLKSSRDRIVYYWEVMQSRAEDRFFREIERALVRGRCDRRNWQLPAFAGLVENVETLAVQRGLRRWEP